MIRWNPTMYLRWSGPRTSSLITVSTNGRAGSALSAEYAAAGQVIEVNPVRYQLVRILLPASSFSITIAPTAVLR